MSYVIPAIASIAMGLVGPLSVLFIHREVSRFLGRRRAIAARLREIRTGRVKYDPRSDARL